MLRFKISQLCAPGATWFVFQGGKSDSVDIPWPLQLESLRDERALEVQK
jgi:hypothetical protein